MTCKKLSVTFSLVQQLTPHQIQLNYRHPLTFERITISKDQTLKRATFAAQSAVIWYTPAAHLAC